MCAAAQLLGAQVQLRALHVDQTQSLLWVNLAGHHCDVILLQNFGSTQQLNLNRRGRADDAAIIQNN